MEESVAKRPHIVRRLYDWVLHWAATPYGAIALFLISFAESSFFPIPPDVLLVPLCLGNRQKAFRFALICSAASVLGGIAGYWIGAGFWEVAKGFFIPYIFSQETFNTVVSQYEKYNFWIVFIAAFTPIPYKAITISAGVCGISFLPFVIASVIGRAGRFYLVAGLIYLFGPSIARFIDKYFEWVAVGLAVLAIAGFMALKYWL